MSHTTPPTEHDRSLLSRLWEVMVAIRRFEETMHDLAAAKELPGYAHSCAGQEAVAAGVIELLGPRDWITSTYRGHGHAIARGVPLAAIAAELYGRASGVCHGKGGSMHIADQSLGMIGAMGIVAGGLPMINGAAFAAQYQDTDAVAVAFFGDGAVHQGAFHEALNFAALFSLPTIFVCENNQYAATSAVEFHLPLGSVRETVAGYALPAVTVDGMDVLAVYDVAAEAIQRARAGGGPTLIEALTYRFHGQYEGDDNVYRPPEEFERWRRRDPLTVLSASVTASGALSDEDLQRVDSHGPCPGPARLCRGRRRSVARRRAGHHRRLHDVTSNEKNMPRTLNIKDAINEALAQEMANDERVVLFGEDIAGGRGREDDYPPAADAWGGPFGVTKGLLGRFGRRRVIDTAIAEDGFVGASIGAAVAGLRPVAEIMYVDFIGTSFDQVLNHAAKLRYTYGGKVSVPMVIRTVTGAGFRAGPEHSQTLYSLYTHVPGLKVVAPATAYDAKGLLIQAIRDPDPVVFLEHKRLYMLEGDVPEAAYTIPLGSASTVRIGSDVTVIGIQKMAHTALAAAAELEGDGVDVEVIDPRCYSPLDTECILASVRKTGRVVIVDESHPRCSLATDIAALIADRAFDELRAPVRCVTAPHAPVPFSPVLEDAYIPSAATVVGAIRDVVGRDRPPGRGSPAAKW